MRLRSILIVPAIVVTICTLSFLAIATLRLMSTGPNGCPDESACVELIGVTSPSQWMVRPFLWFESTKRTATYCLLDIAKNGATLRDPIETRLIDEMSQSKWDYRVMVLERLFVAATPSARTLEAREFELKNILIHGSPEEQIPILIALKNLVAAADTWLPDAIRGLELVAENEAAWKRGIEQIPSGPQLLQLETMHDIQNQKLRKVFTEALSMLGSHDLGPILRSLESPHPLVRELATLSIENNTSPDLQMVTPVLRKLLGDPTPEVQRAARRALRILREE